MINWNLDNRDYSEARQENAQACRMSVHFFKKIGGDTVCRSCKKHTPANHMQTIKISY